MSQHPLLLYPVIKHLIGNLDFEDLLPFRQVCCTWKYHADLNLQPRTQVKITSAAQLTRFCNEVSPNHSFFSNYELNGFRLEKSMHFFDIFGRRISSLNLHFCDWKSATLRKVLFKKVPNLLRLGLSTNKNAGQWLDPILPMSIVPYGTFCPLAKLTTLRISGDYSNRTDLFYDMLKSGPNLEVIHLSKYHDGQDDLFGTWLTEIILSCDFPYLKCLELDCSLIQLQIDSIISKQWPLRRLSMDLDFNEVNLDSLIKDLMLLSLCNPFQALESAEFGILNASTQIVNSVIRRYGYPKGWVASQTKKGSKLKFSKHVLAQK